MQVQTVTDGQDTRTGVGTPAVCFERPDGLAARVRKCQPRTPAYGSEDGLLRASERSHAVKVGQLSEEELAGMLKRPERARAGCSELRAKHRATLDGWAEWLGQQFPDGSTFATLTYSDINGAARSAYTPQSCFRDAHRWVREFGNVGSFFLVAEPHKHRSILHLHGLVQPMDLETAREAAAVWEQDRGYARLLPAVAGAFPYVVKYTLKTPAGAGHDCIDLGGLRRGR